MQNHFPPTDPDSFLALTKASADALRLSILRVLSQDSFGVLELCKIFDTKQSGMSHHLKILAGAGLVTTRREGNSIFYRRLNGNNEGGLEQLQSAILSAADKLPLTAETISRVEAIQEERATRSLEFFKDNAEKFRQHQEQIVEYDVYGLSTADLVRKTISGKPDTALELGPGEGVFLAELSPLFKEVVALDNSKPMLERAQRFVNEKKLDNVSFIPGDTHSKSIAPESIDCIVVNMVLHHVPSPADIFTDLKALLKSGGHLFITDLCSHDQSWVQEACGDLWLGLDPQDISQWGENAGLIDGKKIYLTQRNGFRIQIRHFIKP